MYPEWLVFSLHSKCKRFLVDLTHLRPTLLPDAFDVELPLNLKVSYTPSFPRAALEYGRFCISHISGPYRSVYVDSDAYNAHLDVSGLPDAIEREPDHVDRLDEVSQLLRERLQHERKLHKQAHERFVEQDRAYESVLVQSVRSLIKCCEYDFQLLLISNHARTSVVRRFYDRTLSLVADSDLLTRAVLALGLWTMLRAKLLGTDQLVLVTPDLVLYHNSRGAFDEELGYHIGCGVCLDRPYHLETKSFLRHRKDVDLQLGDDLRVSVYEGIVSMKAQLDYSYRRADAVINTVLRADFKRIDRYGQVTVIRSD